MITSTQATEIEERLATMLEVSVEELRDYVFGNVHSGPGRRTGFRFVRGTHGGSYVRDPDGTDVLPKGWQEPPLP